MPRINLAIGLPGNLLSFVVIVRMRPFSTSSLYLCGMAVSDFLYLISSYVYRFAFNTSEVSLVLLGTPQVPFLFFFSFF